MTDTVELIRKYEPVLVFSRDGDDSSERFFPLAAGDFVRECRLRRQGGLFKEGEWLDPPSDGSLLRYLGEVEKSKECYLVYAADSDELLKLRDQGFELARVGDTVMPRLLTSREGADLLEQGLSESQPEWEMERQPLGAWLPPEELGGGEDALATLFGLQELRWRREEVDLEPPDSEGIEWIGELEDPSVTAALEAVLAASPVPDQIGGGEEDALATLFGVDTMAAQMEWVTLSRPTFDWDTILEKAMGKYEAYRDKDPVYHFHLWKDERTGWCALQYWLLYAFNDWQAHDGHNNHEGDWEMVCVFLDEKEAPRWVASSVHILRPKKARWRDLLKAEGAIWQETHPVIYVGCGSHANYLQRRPNGERGPYKYWLGCTYYDYAAGNDASIGPVGSGMDRCWGEPIWLDREPWNTGFRGNWGALLKSWLGLMLPGTGGPTGPAQKDRKWNRPDTWAFGLPGLWGARLK